eukprot:TRINITY_DN2061_c0_g1_i3.p1 TRINITY_DN2061_c0_g1~~TRINITY_DN2061_c0_g1_i3.p1  ORF type:complete len:268 (+),score=24.95 TRINITY_DN2061_c0_g1_i3:219-1022(+)
MFACAYILLHFEGIFAITLNILLLFYINRNFKLFVKDRPRNQEIVKLMLILFIQVNLTYIYFANYHPWKCLVLLPGCSAFEYDDISGIVWLIVTNDIMARSGMLFLKCIYFISSDHVNGQVFSLMEIISNMYRVVLPIPLWFNFCNYFGQYLYYILVSVYIFIKCAILSNEFKSFFVGVRSLIKGESQWGKYVSEEELIESGTHSCSICQDDFVKPISLPCAHYYCESCIGTWLEKKKTCPICREVVTNAGSPSFRDGGTTMFIEFF